MYKTTDSNPSEGLNNRTNCFVEKEHIHILSVKNLGSYLRITNE